MSQVQCLATLSSLYTCPGYTHCGLALVTTWVLTIPRSCLDHLDVSPLDISLGAWQSQPTHSPKVYFTSSLLFPQTCFSSSKFIFAVSQLLVPQHCLPICCKQHQESLSCSSRKPERHPAPFLPSWPPEVVSLTLLLSVCLIAPSVP